MKIKKNKPSYITPLDELNLTSCAECLIANLDNLAECTAKCGNTAMKLIQENERNLRTGTPPGDSALKLTG